ncbi:MAG: hypothetical protein IPP99_05430 [Chitinophagaceae bacterium]|jgi:hypothetical protein|nr:hypothetical protein [Chitinophagaceae bacterium]
MANILTGIISLEAKGVSQTTSQVSNAVGKAEQSLKRLTPASNQATLAMTNLGRVAQDAPFGFLGIANNLNPLLESFQRLKATTGTTGGALKALGSSLIGPAGLGFAISAASSLLVVFGDKLFSAGKKSSEAADNFKKLSDATKAIFEGAGKEAAEVSTLIAVLKSETETRERKLIAIKELQKIQPEVFNGIKLEGNAVSGLDDAYKNYISNLRTVIAVKIKQAQLEQLITKQLQLQGATRTNTENALFDAVNNFQDSQLNAARQDPSQRGAIAQSILGKRGELKGELNQVQADIDFILRQIGELSKGVKLTNTSTGNITVNPDRVTVKPLTAVFDIDLEGPAVFAADSFGNYFSTELGNYFKRPITTDFSLLQALQPKLKTEAQKLAESFNSILSAGFQDSFSSLGEGLGNALSGKDFGAGLTQALGGLLSSLGKALIQYGAIKEGLDKIFGAGGFAIPGAVAIGLGVLAIAAGKAISNFGGGRAVGGAVKAGTGYLVGENGPEYFQPGTSGSIIPNGRLSTMSGGGFAGRVVFEISGNKLIGVLANGNRSQGALI